MRARGGELVATDEPTVIAKSLLDPIVMENGQSGGCLANSTGTDESDWSEAFRETNNLLDQLVAPKGGPRWRGRGFSGYARVEYKSMDPLIV